MKLLTAKGKCIVTISIDRFHYRPLSGYYVTKIYHPFLHYLSYLAMHNVDDLVADQEFEVGPYIQFIGTFKHVTIIAK